MPERYPGTTSCFLSPLMAHRADDLGEAVGVVDAVDLVHDDLFSILSDCGVIDHDLARYRLGRAASS